MIDRIYYKSKYEIVVIYSSKAPTTIFSSEGNALQLYEWLTTPTIANLTLVEFISANNEESTQCITLKAA